MSTRNVLSAPHGLTGISQNTEKPAAKASVRQYIRDVAEAYGHPLPIAYRQSDQKRMEEEDTEESIIFLPPKYSKNSMHLEYNSLQVDTTLCVSRKTFCTIMDMEMPFVRVSLRARGLCDICFLYKDIVRKTPDEILSKKAEEWAVHLELAAITRCIYRASLERARNTAKYLLPLRMDSATISYDYAKQLSIPLLCRQTMNEWFAQKKGYDVNLFGIVDEGKGENGHQYNFIYGEGTKHGSIQVASMLNHFLQVTCAPIGQARKLFLHSDSCTGQNKNNILLGYFMLRVAHGYHDEIIWQFMAVGHTKFRPDEGFGLIRTYVDGRADVLSMEEMRVAIENSSSSNTCVIFPVEVVQDWKAVSKTFKALYGIRKNFAYKIHIRAETKDGKRTVLVDVYHKPDGEQPDTTVNLMKNGVELPTLSSFIRVPPTAMSEARRAGLENDVYAVLKRNRVTMSTATKSWWENDVLQGIEEA